VGLEGGPRVNFDAPTQARLLGVFVAEAEETVEALRAATSRLGEGDLGAPLTDFGRVAHGLKGAAGSIGLEPLARGLHGLETLALAIRGDDPAGRAARLVRVRRALDVLEEGIARMASSGAGAFPADAAERLLAAVSAPGTAAAAGDGEGEGEGAAPGPSATTTPRPTPLVRGAADGGERLSVPAADVDEALRVAASLARAAVQLHERLAAADPGSQAVAASAVALEALVASLRLVPADGALSNLDEEVAELGARLGKPVTLAVAGREVRADRRTLQSARGMIRHLVRNAVDHGLEEPGARAAAGKPREGRITVAVEAVESALRVEVADDGAGFDLPALRRELARRTGDPAHVQSLSDDVVLQRWAFEGGSTRTTATEISGRGLGLSAVAQLARESGGGIQVRSVRGLGSAVSFTLPLQVYAVEALVIEVAGRTFGVPLAAIDRTVHLAASGAAVHSGPSGATLAVDERILPLAPLAEALGGARATGRERFAVIVRSDAGHAALAVDDVGAVTGIVPGTVPGVAQPGALVTGVARLGDGTPIALLDPRLLLARVREARTVPRSVSAPASVPAPTPDAAPARSVGALDVVLAEDSLATREVLRVLLEAQGFRVRLAADGEEALDRIAEARPDVLVSDVNMPRRDGLSLTRAVRARPETERLPIVLLTSQDDAATRSAGAAAGADAYLVKSQFNAGVLAETLARLGVRPA
jgi:two-component system, chemotaxis family, sensor kinase CheA